MANQQPPLVPEISQDQAIDNQQENHQHYLHQDEEPDANLAESTANAAGDSATGNGAGGRKKRLCRYPGCTKVIKSQGMCQRHGAKAKRCKVEGCDKQAQGTHDGMCKRHWKLLNSPDGIATAGGHSHPPRDALPPPPEGDSIYDTILPQSISYRPASIPKESIPELNPGEDPPLPADNINVMPLVDFLKKGYLQHGPGWHRHAERRAKGAFPIANLNKQLDPWERQTILAEILLLSGGTPYANFTHLAHAWGREKGFHLSIVNKVCERRGEVERKRCSDALLVTTATTASSQHHHNYHNNNEYNSHDHHQMVPPPNRRLIHNHDPNETTMDPHHPAPTTTTTTTTTTMMSSHTNENGGGMTMSSVESTTATELV